MKAVREGAQDYLVKGNADGNVLARCIRFAIERHLGSSARSQEKPRIPCKMLGFLGSKGGVGATTVACSFAMALQSETKQTVLLADLDFESSVLGFLLGVESQYSLMDALRNADRLDASLWKPLVCSISPGLEIITGPAPVIPEEEVGAEQFQQVVGFVRANYQWLVADLGRGFNQHFRRVLGDLDQIYVVTTPELAALRQARLIVQNLRQPENEGDRLRLVLNDVPKGHSFSVHEFQEALGFPIWATIPHVPELRQDHGRSTSLPKIPALMEAVAKLAAKAAGIPEEKAKGR
jgi:pilus assembly protein CpaE